MLYYYKVLYILLDNVNCSYIVILCYIASAFAWLWRAQKAIGYVVDVVLITTAHLIPSFCQNDPTSLIREGR